MTYAISTTPWTAVEADWLVVPVVESPIVDGPLADLDRALGGALVRMQEAGDLTGKANAVLSLPAVSGIKARRLLLVGLGKLDELNDATLYKAYLTAVRAITGKAVGRLACAVPTAGPAAYALERRVESIQAAVEVAGVGQDLYRTERKRFPVGEVQILVSAGTQPAAIDEAARQGEILGQAINLTRTLVNQPPAVMFPASFAEQAASLATEYGLHCGILDERALIAERMHSLLAVAAGSDQPPRMVVLEYNAGAAGAPVLALVGKGVTFDSGGLSLKTNEGMLTMKCDMAGAATVLGAMVAIARMKLPVNVVGYMGLVENLPNGRCMKLGDVLKARNGVTIEVLNTDAEGRLVLADVLSYAVDRVPDYLIDLATLTGACVVALGEHVVGAFTNNQPWCDAVLAAAQTAGEEMWQLPMFDLYEEQIKGDVGDIKNTGGRWGGAITAAKFLAHFVGDKPWVHLDIAGPAFASSDKPYREAGGTGAMVRTLVEAARGMIAKSWSTSRQQVPHQFFTVFARPTVSIGPENPGPPAAT